jgi:hypothetical protein
MDNLNRDDFLRRVRFDHPPEIVSRLEAAWPVSEQTKSYGEALGLLDKACVGNKQPAFPTFGRTGPGLLHVKLKYK